MSNQTPDRAPTYEELRDALHKALDHLDYCGWGDAWERQRAETLRPELLDIDARAYRMPPPERRLAAVAALVTSWRQSDTVGQHATLRALEFALEGRTTWAEQQALYDASPLSHLHPASEDWRRTALYPYGGGR